MSWADEASRDAKDAAHLRNEMWDGGDYPTNPINPAEYNNTPTRIFESLQPVDGECPCQEDHGVIDGQKKKCGSTALMANTGFCTACVFGCLP